jgi:hypothetical protein
VKRRVALRSGETEIHPPPGKHAEPAEDTHYQQHVDPMVEPHPVNPGLVDESGEGDRDYHDLDREPPVQPAKQHDCNALGHHTGGE